MTDILQQLVEATEKLMIKSIDYLDKELIRIRAGKASPEILENVLVDYYGSPTPIQQIANISVSDARTLTVQPWEKKMLAIIEKGILASNIGITPQNDGNIIRLFLPPLTEERRKELVKKSHVEGELAKVSVRNIRRDSIEEVKKNQKNGLSEDMCKNAEKEIQQLTDKCIVTVEKALETKEKEIMTL